ncbi:MAG: SOS response-associated peptidase family protein [Steroidobacteraceae bacterium]
MVEQHLRSLAREFRARVDWDTFEALFHERAGGQDIKVARGLEANFSPAPGESVPKSGPEAGPDPERGSWPGSGSSPRPGSWPGPAPDLECRTRAHIEAYRRELAASLERELFKQKRRLADAERSLGGRETRRARENERIARCKGDSLLSKISDLRRTEPEERDDRIFPMYYAPVLVEERGSRLIRPMRYTCRLPGKPASDDRRYPGTYNARRDSLRGFWAGLYGHRHAVLVITSFFENVPLHVLEKRELAPGEASRSTVLHFDPRPRAPMLVVCLWSRWTGTDGDNQLRREEHPGHAREHAGRAEEQSRHTLSSFAAITDDPPPEIAATGHNRCIIPIKRANLDEWLAPQRVGLERLDEILTDRERPFYAHRIAA